MRKQTTLSSRDSRLAMAGAGLIMALTLAGAGAGETVSESFVAKATTISGSGSQSQRFNYVALGKVNEVTYAGTITATAADSLEDNGAGWSQNQFNGDNGAYYVEFASGAMVDILLTENSPKRLVLTGLLPSDADVGQSYKVRRHVTIADIFGPNNEAGLQPGFNASTSDNIMLLIPETQMSETYFYADIPDFEGWYRHDYLAADDVIIYPEQGFVIRRRGNADITLFVDGVEKAGPARIPVFSGYNLLGTISSEGSLTLADLNIYTGNPDTGLAAGTSPSSADNIVLIRPDQTGATYFYSSVPGFTGWYDVSYAASGNVAIEAGTAFFVNRKSQRPMFNWDIPNAQ